MNEPLGSVVIILVEPQSVDNVGAALRALRNMGLDRLRLVRPAPFDMSRLPVIAHRSMAQAKRIDVFDELDAAVADAVYVVGCSARRRAAPRPVLSPREAARAALARTPHGNVAFLFGREDYGLPNTALDLCHAVLTIPADAEYPSLNLAQAVLIVAYELRLAALGPTPPPARPTAPGSALERMFSALEHAMQTLDFLVPSRAEATLRALRVLLLRAEPSDDEVALITALATAIRKRERQAGEPSLAKPASE